MISILVNRKFKINECLLLARVNCRAKKQLALCGQLSPVSANRSFIFVFLIIMFKVSMGVIG